MTVTKDLESNCSECNQLLESTWLTWKGKTLCVDCWAEMKDAPKIKCIRPEDLINES